MKFNKIGDDPKFLEPLGKVKENNGKLSFLMNARSRKSLYLFYRILNGWFEFWFLIGFRNSYPHKKMPLKWIEENRGTPQIARGQDPEGYPVCHQFRIPRTGLLGIITVDSALRAQRGC